MEFNERSANEYIPKFSQMYQSWYEINALTSWHFQSSPYDQPCGEVGLTHITEWIKGVTFKSSQRTATRQYNQEVHCETIVPLFKFIQE